MGETWSSMGVDENTYEIIFGKPQGKETT